MIGNAAKADQVYYWESEYQEETMEWLISQKIEWNSRNKKIKMANPELQKVAFKKSDDLIKELMKNESFILRLKDCDQNHSAKKFLQSQDFSSCLIIPIFVEGKLKGSMGFNSYHAEKKWSELEISLLTSFILLYEKAFERNKLKERILQSKNNFYNFFNMTQEFLFVIDEEGHIIENNHNVLNKLHYDEDQLKGKKIFELYSNKNQEKVRANLEGILKERDNFIDVPILTKEGKEIPVQTEFSKGTWNKKPVIFAVLKNITELTLSEAKFSKAFNNGGLAKFISKYEDGEFVEVNDTFIKFLGYTREEIIGQTTLAIKMTKDYDNREIFKQMLKEDNKIEDLEINYIRKDGSQRVGLTNIVPLTINNEKHLLSSIIDISERIKYEKNY